METNNIVTAPQVINAQRLYAGWSTTNDGGLNEFYNLLTNPSASRSAFLSQHREELKTEFNGKVLAVTINPR